jgi:glucose-6-phosphate isomerase
MSAKEYTVTHLDPTRTEAWQELKQLKLLIAQTRLQDHFHNNPNRAAEFTLHAAGLTVDLSKNHLDQSILKGFERLADEMQLPAAINALRDGKEINFTERRAAQHTKLRDLDVNGMPKDPDVASTFQQVCGTADKIRSGGWQGHTGKTITDIVNIGIGGSDLGPRTVCNALQIYQTTDIQCHFVSNCDPSDLYQTLDKLNPESTLFIVSSKSFTTQETLTNAEAARDWLLLQLSDKAAIKSHFLAVTSRPEKASSFGISEKNIFPMWDWVGGRFSLWSAIGLPIAIQLGSKGFTELLRGAQAMDEHYTSAPVTQNIPILMGLLDVWHVNFWGAESIACMPYDHYLQLLPDFLQQLIMESNGKSIDRAGNPINYSTCPAIWGGIGSNGQHSFHQLLHQGTHFIPCDFILPLASHNPIGNQHATLVANGLSQSLALMRGKTLREAQDELQQQGLSSEEIERLAPHKVIPGNQPSTLIMYPKTTPATLGALLALYEHRVYTASVIWNINAFDQWGVELGKSLSNELQPLLTGENDQPATLDGSTQAAIDRFRQCNA